MAGWWEAEIGLCYREQGIACAEGTCGHCDGARTKSKGNKMARETKAERLAREALEQQEMMLQLEKEYPLRLMATLTRAYKNNFEVVPKDTMFQLVDRDLYSKFTVSHQFSLKDDQVLDELAWTLDLKEERAREEQRKSDVRNAALSRLSDEEKMLLGLK